MTTTPSEQDEPRCNECRKPITGAPVLVERIENDATWDRFVGADTKQMEFCSTLCAEEWCYDIYCK